MKKFNKKAVFAALIGALSSVSSFADKAHTVDNGQLFLNNRRLRLSDSAGEASTAIGKARTVDNGQLFSKRLRPSDITGRYLKARVIDNANLFQHKNISQDNRIMFLDKNDPNLNLSQDELEKIFKQMAEVEYISFDHGGIIKTRQELEENLKYFTETKKIPTRENFIVSNPTLYKRNQKDINEKKNLKIKEIYDELKDDYNKSDKWRKKYLLYKDKSKNSIDGFISFCNPFTKYPNAVLIYCLANKKSGVGGNMIREMQRHFNHLVLFPIDDNAENFYTHMGFHDKNGLLEWRRHIKIK